MHFSKWVFNTNSKDKEINNEELAHIMSYSIIMLNKYLYNKKTKYKITPELFINKDLPDYYFNSNYESVKKKRITYFMF